MYGTQYDSIVLVTTSRAPRDTLDRERVLSAAFDRAGSSGLDSLTIRALAADLGVRPMAIYHYVASKEELLDALVDRVFAEVYSPISGDWRSELHRRSTSLREVLNRHPWALPFVETRAQPGLATLAHHNAVIETLRSSGFSLLATAHAYAILDAFVFGIVLQEAMLASAGIDEPDPLVAGMGLTRFPRVLELASLYMAEPAHEFGASFEVGLSVVLDGIERLATQYPEPDAQTSIG